MMIRQILSTFGLGDMVFSSCTLHDYKDGRCRRCEAQDPYWEGDDPDLLDTVGGKKDDQPSTTSCPSCAGVGHGSASGSSGACGTCGGTGTVLL